MTPLDLTRQPPRSCREEIDGIRYLARAIDKVRAALPGGNVSNYVIVRDDMATVSSLFYRKLGIEHEAFVAAVRDATADADVAAWLRAHTDAERIAGWNRVIFNLRVGMLDPQTRARLEKAHPGAPDVTDETFVVDVFDADDRATFASTA